MAESLTELLETFDLFRLRVVGNTCMLVVVLGELLDACETTEALTAAVRGLVVCGNADEVAALAGLRDAVEAVFVHSVDLFDRAGLAQADVEPSTWAWLRNRAGLAQHDANAVVSLASRLRNTALTAPRWRSGELSGGIVKLVAANVTSRRGELFRAHEAETLAALTSVYPTDAVTVMQRWVANADVVLDDSVDPPPADPQALYASKTLANKVEVSGTLDAETGTAFREALRAAQSPDIEGQPRTAATRRADALG